MPGDLPGAAGVDGRRLAVGIVDDHPVVPGSLTLLLREAGFAVLPPAHSVETIGWPDPPDVVLCDVLLDGQSPGRVLSRGAAVTALVDRGWRVLSISGTARPATVVEAIAAGALGYLPKTVPTGVYAHAVRQVVRRGWHLSATLAGFLADDARRRPLDHDDLGPVERAVLRSAMRGEPIDEITDRLGLTAAQLDATVHAVFATTRRRHREYRLTDRQLDLLRLVGGGHLSNKQAARRLGIAPDSVQWHLENIRTRYAASHPEQADVGPRAAAHLWAIELGLDPAAAGPQVSGVSPAVPDDET